MCSGSRSTTYDSICRSLRASRTGPRRRRRATIWPADALVGQPLEPVEQGRRPRRHGDRREIRLPDEALVGGVPRDVDQRPPEAVDVEQPDRLRVQAELRPRQLLEQLVERPEAARKRSEPVGELGHQRLSLVQRPDDVQLGQSAVGELAIDEQLRDDADHLAARPECAVGDRAHQPDAPAAVDDPDPAAAAAAPNERAASA